MELIPLEMKPTPCGYFDDRQALFEHYLIESAEVREREALLAYGFRSFGKYTFRPQCQNCKRCIPLRIPVRFFHPHKKQRRVLKRAQELKLIVGEPEYTEEKLAIYRAHGQRFSQMEAASKEEEFRFSFYEPSVPTLEFTYYLGETLIAVGIVHETPIALSSVYFTYLPEYSHLSLGTYSILKEIEWAQTHGKHHLYLGYYIRENHFMSYKSHFYPSEILLDYRDWVPFRDPEGNYVPQADDE